MARSTARKRALNTLYEADEKGQDILSLLAERIARPGAQTPLPDYAITIVRGVADHASTIDRALADHSNGWNIRRMAVVDRNILRIAAWEILGNDEVPDKVAIDEALGLAKTLSDGESLSFIHGLLSSLCRDKDHYDFTAEPSEQIEPDEQSKPGEQIEPGERSTQSDSAGQTDAVSQHDVAPESGAIDNVEDEGEGDATDGDDSSQQDGEPNVTPGDGDQTA